MDANTLRKKLKKQQQQLRQRELQQLAADAELASDEALKGIAFASSMN